MGARREIPPALAVALEEMRLGMPSEDHYWIALYPQLGAIYLAAVAERVALANDMAVVTDRPL